MLTIVLLLIAQFPVHRGPSFFLEVFLILQQIVLCQSTVVEGLFVICNAVSIISTDNTQPCSILPTEIFLNLYHSLLFIFVYRQVRLRVSGLYFVKSLINDESRKTDMTVVVARIKQQT